MEDERGRENVSLLYSAACAQTICACLNGHAPLFSTRFWRFRLCIYIYLYVFQPLVSPWRPFLSSSTTSTTTVTTINRRRRQTTGGNYNTTINVIHDDEWLVMERIGKLGNWYVKFLYSYFFSNRPFICFSYGDKKWQTSLRRWPQSMGAGRYEQQWWWWTRADDEWWCRKGLEKWDVGM
jgi:hypothetical protein